MELLIAIAIVLSAGLVSSLGYGKFWHRHQWELNNEVVTDSIYSNKKNLSKIFKCKNCRAFKLKTVPMKESK